MNERVLKSVQCSATIRKTGERCRRQAIKGGTVCYKHGGAAPQVKRKAEETLKEWRIRRAIQIEKGFDHILGTPDGKKLSALIVQSPALLPKLLDIADQFRGGGSKTELTVNVEPDYDYSKLTTEELETLESLIRKITPETSES